MNLVGRRFGRLCVIESAGKSKTGRARWHCVCDCGRTSTPQASNLLSGKTISCGCVHKEKVAQMGRFNKRHGMRKSAEYQAWASMIDRCSNPKHKRFKDWGGRGITVCERWRQSFVNFFKDMGSRPSSVHSLDRINNDGNYEPGNCRWATKKQQVDNRRISKRMCEVGRIEKAA